MTKNSVLEKRNIDHTCTLPSVGPSHYVSIVTTLVPEHGVSALFFFFFFGITTWVSENSGALRMLRAHNELWLLRGRQNKLLNCSLINQIFSTNPQVLFLQHVKEGKKLIARKAQALNWPDRLKLSLMGPFHTQMHTCMLTLNACIMPSVFMQVLNSKAGLILILLLISGALVQTCG